MRSPELTDASTPEGRLTALARELEAAARDLPEAALPALLGELERLRWIVQLRLATGQGPARAEPAPLLTTEAVARRLGGISADQVYRLAKGALRTAAVEVGEGTLRFDPARLERFIEARRRG